MQMTMPVATKAEATRQTQLQDADEVLFDRLKKLRREIAQEQNVPAYVVFSDATLVEIARYIPKSLAEMRRISGFGEVKLARYGPAFLEEVLAHTRQLA